MQLLPPPCHRVQVEEGQWLKGRKRGGVLRRLVRAYWICRGGWKRVEAWHQWSKICLVRGKKRCKFWGVPGISTSWIWSGRERRQSIDRKEENKNFRENWTETVCLSEVQRIWKVVCLRTVSAPVAFLPCGSWLDVAGVRAAGAGGLSLPGQEGLAGAGVGKSVLSRLLLDSHALRKDAGDGQRRLYIDSIAQYELFQHSNQRISCNQSTDCDAWERELA